MDGDFLFLQVLGMILARFQKLLKKFLLYSQNKQIIIIYKLYVTNSEIRLSLLETHLGLA